MGDEPPPTLTIRRTRIREVFDRRVTSQGARGRGAERDRERFRVDWMGLIVKAD